MHLGPPRVWDGDCGSLSVVRNSAMGKEDIEIQRTGRQKESWGSIS